MLIDCPYCGARPSEEFTILGDATKERPSGIQPPTWKPWYDYVFIRDNPKGRHREYWQHSGGCRSWLVVERDTLTHQVYAVDRSAEHRPMTSRRLAQGGLIDRARPLRFTFDRQALYRPCRRYAGLGPDRQWRAR